MRLLLLSSKDMGNKWGVFEYQKSLQSSSSWAMSGRWKWLRKTQSRWHNQFQHYLCTRTYLNFYFWITGWTLVGEWPKGVKECGGYCITHTLLHNVGICLYIARAAFFLMDTVPRWKFTLYSEKTKRPRLVGSLSMCIAFPVELCMRHLPVPTSEANPGGKKQTYTWKQRRLGRGFGYSGNECREKWDLVAILETLQGTRMRYRDE